MGNRKSERDKSSKYKLHKSSDVSSKKSGSFVKTSTAWLSTAHIPKKIAQTLDNATSDFRTSSNDAILARHKESRIQGEKDIAFQENLTSTLKQLAQLDDYGSYLSDRERKIDFMLVHEGLDESKTDKNTLWRKAFFINLKALGLRFEKDVVQTSKTTLVFTKVHVPFEVLCLYAEKLYMKAPVEKVAEQQLQETGYLSRCCGCLYSFTRQIVPQKPERFYRAPFKRVNLARYYNHHNKACFFLDKDRQRIAFEILSNMCFGIRAKAEVGIHQLIIHGAFCDAYPLHDSAIQLLHKNTSRLSKRQILYWYWARFPIWYKEQPLDHIREYFGEKIAMYFAWLGFYTTALLPPALMGLITLLDGIIMMPHYHPSKFICESGTNLLMCPPCDEKDGCQYYYLSDYCMFITVTFLFDNTATVAYSVFMVIWATLFLKLWKRKCMTLADDWGVMDLQEEQAQPTAYYLSKCTIVRENPVTGVLEPSYPEEYRWPWKWLSIAVLILMILLSLAGVVLAIFYRGFITQPLYKMMNGPLDTFVPSITNSSSSVLQVIFIVLLSLMWSKIAYVLTKWEMHRTQQEFEESYVFKLFIFDLVNEYGIIIYIAFFKGRYKGYPGHYNRLFGQVMEECLYSACIIELSQFMAIILIFRQTAYLVLELLFPRVLQLIQVYQSGMGGRLRKSRWESDYELAHSEGLYLEYQKIVTQFGFIVLFGPAFPLAPLFAFLNNCLEIRLDASKFVMDQQRTVAEPVRGLGIWQDMMNLIANLSVITNALLIAFTSEFLTRLVYQRKYGSLQGYTDFLLAHSPNGTTAKPCRYTSFRDDNGNYTDFFWYLLLVRLAFVVVFEHVVVGIIALISIFVEDAPESIRQKMARQQYLARQTLTDEDILMINARESEDIMTYV